MSNDTRPTTPTSAQLSKQPSLGAQFGSDFIAEQYADKMKMSPAERMKFLAGFAQFRAQEVRFARNAHDMSILQRVRSANDVSRKPQGIQPLLGQEPINPGGGGIGTLGFEVKLFDEFLKQQNPSKDALLAQQVFQDKINGVGINATIEEISEALLNRYPTIAKDNSTQESNTIDINDNSRAIVITTPQLREDELDRLPLKPSVVEKLRANGMSEKDIEAFKKYRNQKIMKLEQEYLRRYGHYRLDDKLFADELAPGSKNIDTKKLSVLDRLVSALLSIFRPTKKFNIVQNAGRDHAEVHVSKASGLKQDLQRYGMKEADVNASVTGGGFFNRRKEVRIVREKFEDGLADRFVARREEIRNDPTLLAQKAEAEVKNMVTTLGASKGVPGYAALKSYQGHDAADGAHYMKETLGIVTLEGGTTNIPNAYFIATKDADINNTPRLLTTDNINDQNNLNNTTPHLLQRTSIPDYNLAKQIVKAHAKTYGLDEEQTSAAVKALQNPPSQSTAQR